MKYLAAVILVPQAFAAGLVEDPSAVPLVPTESAEAPEFQQSSSSGDWITALATTGVTYNSNILNDAFNEESDLIYIASLAMTLSDPEISRTDWSLIYTPAYRFYQDNSQLDGFDQSIEARFTKELPKTTFDTAASYKQSSGSNRFTNGFVDSDIYNFTAEVSHYLTGKTRLDALYSMTDSSYGGAVSTPGSGTTLPDTNTQSLRLAAFHSLTGKLNLGPYASYGTSSVTDGNDHSTYELGLATEYFATGKTSIHTFAGYELREFSGANAGDRESFAMSLGAKYDFSAKTVFALDLYRRSLASPSSSRDGYDATGASLGCKYQMTEKVGFYSSVSYELAEYYSTINGAPSITQDAAYFVYQIGSDYKIRENLTLGGSLQYAENDSKAAADSYDNIIAILQASYKF